MPQFLGNLRNDAQHIGRVRRGHFWRGSDHILPVVWANDDWLRSLTETLPGIDGILLCLAGKSQRFGHEAILSTAFHHERRITLHALVILCQNSSVTIQLPETVWNQNSYIRPANAAVHRPHIEVRGVVMITSSAETAIIPATTSISVFLVLDSSMVITPFSPFFSIASVIISATSSFPRKYQKQALMKMVTRDGDLLLIFCTLRESNQYRPLTTNIAVDLLAAFGYNIGGGGFRCWMN